MSIVIILLTGIIVVLFSERLAKRIPDSKTGILGAVRKGLKVISLYTPNVE